MTEILALIFGLVTVVPVIYMIFSKNLVRSVYAFAAAMLGMTGIYVLLNTELMAVVQLLIYAGGVVILFVFGIMLTRRISPDAVRTGHRNLLISASVLLVFFGMLVRWILLSGLAWSGTQDITTNQVQTIGVSFLTDYIFVFEVIALLLLAALVGAAFLAKKSNNA